MKNNFNKPPKNLIIIGAGDFGREVCVWAKQSKENGSFWKIKGFLDDRKDALADYKYYDVGVISEIEKYQPETNDLFICAVGDPKLKKKFISVILEKGGQFTNIIHPTVVIGENVRLGTGSILCPYVVVSSDAVLGDFVTVNLHSSIGHDVKLGDWCFVGPSCSLNGRVVLENSVFMGGNVIVLPGGHIGEGSVVGSGSVVIEPVKPFTTVFGNPAKLQPILPSTPRQRYNGL